jgi:hypothetical protein
MALRTLHCLLRDRLTPMISLFVESKISNKLGLRHARRFTSSSYGTLRYRPDAPLQAHAHSPRTEKAVTEISPRFFLLCYDLTTTLLDQIDHLFHSLGREALRHIQRWMADLTLPTPSSSDIHPLPIPLQITIDHTTDPIPYTLVGPPSPKRHTEKPHLDSPNLS